MAEIPDRLLRRGRPVDPDFPADERLFRRVPRRDLAADGKLLPTAISFPDFSVNREKYCEPSDVVLQHPLHGVAAFQVRDVPPRLENDGDVYLFPLEHVPEEENFSHSEVRTYRNGERPREVRSKAVKGTFRASLFGRIVLIREPLE